MSIIYNRANPLIEGWNTETPLTFLCNGKAYKLTVYPELGGLNTRCALMITMFLQFQFKDGDGGNWAPLEKQNFIEGFRLAVREIWGDRFVITSASPDIAPLYRQVHVGFNFSHMVDGWSLKEDFEVVVTKILPGTIQISSCNYTLGNTYLDTEDLTPIAKGAAMGQRAAAHEFGHMLGLRDEYPDARANLNHIADTDSVMHSGEVVRQRHYALFAEWLNRKFRTLGVQTGFRVNGIIDLSNALL